MGGVAGLGAGGGEVAKFRSTQMREREREEGVVDRRRVRRRVVIIMGPMDDICLVIRGGLYVCRYVQYGIVVVETQEPREGICIWIHAIGEDMQSDYHDGGNNYQDSRFQALGTQPQRN